MMTMEQIKAEKSRLAAMENKLLQLEKIRQLNGMLEKEQVLISATKIEGAFMNSPVHISLVLSEAEQDVMVKSIQVALEFARQRIEKEIENV